MARQLVLLPVSGSDWRLDDSTREAGRQGVARARAILRLVDERAGREANVPASTAASQRSKKPAA